MIWQIRKRKDIVIDLFPLVQLRNGGPGTAGSLPLQWVESQASVLLLTMLQCCSSQYDLHRLLQLLADVDKLLKSNGEMFRAVTSLSNPNTRPLLTGSVQEMQFYC
ncbi:hypothetical protein CHARACLAT_026336 [Characodon lateralis]|uniref:Uncharacterized protein n=1 Tax=Characodon lateralis TaxID=208331 RepID=A0ABU7DKF8_9TELE|nr:hypothetical protein [Characodon lateralis]